MIKNKFIREVEVCSLVVNVRCLQLELKPCINKKKVWCVVIIQRLRNVYYMYSYPFGLSIVCRRVNGQKNEKVKMRIPQRN